MIFREMSNAPELFWGEQVRMFHKPKGISRLTQVP